MLSVVIPVYRNGDTLQELHARLKRVLDAQPCSSRIVFVDDASPDESSAILSELAGSDPRVTVRTLAVNVGQQRAILAGLAAARGGDDVVVMDADLQDGPEAIAALLEKMREGFGAVFAGRRGRFAPSFRMVTSSVFKRILHAMCGVPVDAGMFVAMQARMVRHLLAFPRPGPSVLAMIGCAGLPLASIPVPRSPRRDGRSGYSSWKRLKIGVLSIVWVLSIKRRGNSRSRCACDKPDSVY